MIKAILFDFWGTLIENGVFPSPVRQTRYIMGIRTPFPDYIQTFEQVFMTKRYKDLQEAFSAVFKAFKLKEDPDRIERLIGMWNKNYLFAKPFPETMDVLKKLKEKYQLVLISNTAPFQIEPSMEKFNLGPFFTKVVLSCDVGKLKTDPTLFKDILKELKLKPDEVVMIGDSIETDMKGAEAAGIHGILVDRRGRREYPDKITDLSYLEDKLEGKDE